MINPDIPYNSIALVYDEFGLDEFSIRMIPYIKSILGIKSFRGMKILDLACGTGSAALELANQGADVIAIDSSESMLKLARKKMKASSRKVKFIQADLRTFEVDGSFDLILCLFDTLNHFIHINDVRNILTNAGSRLKSSGDLVFDLNTHYGFRKNWDNWRVVRESDRFYSIWDTVYDTKERIAEITIRAFSKSKNQLIKAAEVTVPERAYTSSEVKKTVKSASLNIVEVFECLSTKPPDADSPRNVYFCKRAWGI
ncbi:MAG: methyltransferase domain-containing protein [candidate division Zixibacteria bacterium]|nr:methyltransferase domain-containing protein [candidate division Zixibacteria bacterium]